MSSPAGAVDSVNFAVVMSCAPTVLPLGKSRAATGTATCRGMLKAIVYIEIPVQRWVGKRKTSQNRDGDAPVTKNEQVEFFHPVKVAGFLTRR